MQKCVKINKSKISQKCDVVMKKKKQDYKNTFL